MTVIDNAWPSFRCTVLISYTSCQRKMHISAWQIMYQWQIITGLITVVSSKTGYRFISYYYYLQCHMNYSMSFTIITVYYVAWFTQCDLFILLLCVKKICGQVIVFRFESINNFFPRQHASSIGSSRSRILQAAFDLRNSARAVYISLCHVWQKNCLVAQITRDTVKSKSIWLCWLLKSQRSLRAACWCHGWHGSAPNLGRRRRLISDQLSRWIGRLAGRWADVGPPARSLLNWRRLTEIAESSASHL